MTTPEHTQSWSLTAKSSLTPVSLSPGDFSRTHVDHKAVPYIELPPLSPTERATYQTVSNRDLPESFDYSLPLSDRVIVGESRDDATHWYYVENVDGIVYRVSTLLVILKIAWY